MLTVSELVTEMEGDKISMDIFTFIGGLIFVVLGVLSFVNRDLMWKLYSLEPAWRRRNPVRTPAWDVRTRTQGTAFLIVGVVFLILSVVLVVE